ncbi:MAG: roadblock/LC7 domain-containing protein [Promethearchaeota archaeon]
MSINITPEIQQQLASILTDMEQNTELIKCVVVTRTGIKIAPDMDADTYSASSAALIDLGERVVDSLSHGTLQELVINAPGGYVILVSVGKEYMLLGATSAALKMGYYLPFMRKKAWELENIIYGETISEFGVLEAIEEEGVESLEEQIDKEIFDAETIKQADMAAMDEVLAAFDELGIDDDFSSQLSQEEVPAVGISDEEMEKITKMLEQQTQEISIEYDNQTIQAQEEQIITTQEEPQAQEEYTCPIPLEPGEVPPFPLDPSELNPFDTNEAATTSSESQPTHEIEQPPSPVDLFKTQPETEQEASNPEPEHPMPTLELPPPPDFENADEYDFDFDNNEDDS